jgi:hypothetical protein
MAHYVDWVAVASELAENAFESSPRVLLGGDDSLAACTSDSCGVAKTPLPLKCLQIWRQEMNERLKLDTSEFGGRFACRIVPWTDQEVRICLPMWDSVFTVSYRL